MKMLLLVMGMVLMIITGLALCQFIMEAMTSDDPRKRFGRVSSALITGFYFAYILWSFLWIWRMK